MLVASLMLAGLILVYRPLPAIDGDYRLLGLEERAVVDRDSFGVPHIFAQNAHDLFYLQGYVTAQDRLFQMELYRRAGAGRLSEVLGDAALDSDRAMRTYGLARVAARELPLLRAETRAGLTAYADGVNKFLEQHGETLPLEFVLLGYRPEKWNAVDSIVIAKLQAYDAAGNMDQELLRADLALRFGPGVLGTLMPDPSGRPTPIDERAWNTVAPLLSQSVRSRPLAAFLPGSGAGAGSNCWALSGARTATGRPFLAGDPHLPVRMPSLWYEIGLAGGGYDVMGFSFAGLPGVVIGHNARIAWSLTYAYTDTQDLFVERQDPTDPRRFEYKGGFEPATFIHETIKVKGRATPEIVDVAITRHGPIVTPLLEGQTAQLALSWTALEPGPLLDFLFGIARAQDWSDFRAAGAAFVGAAVSACYADVDGHIGYQLIGRLPQRPGDGALPVPGWTGEYDWTGLVAPDANPSVFDPPNGLIVNANDRPTADPRAIGYVGEWDPGFRSAYITHRLDASAHADMSAMRTLQTAFTSLPVDRFRDVLVRAATTDPSALRARQIVEAWDGDLSAELAAPAIYESWLVHMCERVFRSKLGEKLYHEYATAARMTFALHQLVARAEDPWFSDVGDPTSRGRDAISGRALEDAVRDLRARLGADPERWRWGELHTITFAHPLAVGPLALLLNIGPLRRPGDGYSVNNEAYDLTDPFAVTTHPSERMIVDLGDLDRSLSVIPAGQSGQPGSKFWGDQTALWAAGDYKPMRFSRDKLGRLDGSLVVRPR